MSYKPISSTDLEEDDARKPHRLRRQLNRHVDFLRQRHLLPTRRLRIILFVLCIFTLWTFFSPLYTRLPRTPPGQIQAQFRPGTDTERTTRLERQSQVKSAFEHAWLGYKSHAWLRDEVRPVSGGAQDPFVGWAATLVDSLDALWILGMREEFEGALRALEEIDFEKPKSERVPVFETTIRYLGGLLGAYDVSDGHYPVLLRKATQLGDFLLRAFQSPSGIPVPYYQWMEPEKNKWDGENGVLIAQIGSLNLEFTRLSQITGDRKYFAAVSKVMDYLDDAQNKTRLPGLWPSQVNTRGPQFNGNAYTLGAWADSLYEYLPKEHLLLGGKTDKYLKMYRFALSSAQKYHFFKPSLPGNPDIIFPGSVKTSSKDWDLQPEVQHLGCFVGGMVALGSRINDSPSELKLAGQLTSSCVWAYEATNTGIMPEKFWVTPCLDKGHCKYKPKNQQDTVLRGFTRVTDKSYALRPEAIESVFIMYRITGDPIWMEKGWDMFQAIMKYTTTNIANAKLVDVFETDKPQSEDSMESFWLAETLKYFYLLFGETDSVSLDEFVLNTEAHPFRLRDKVFEL